MRLNWMIGQFPGVTRTIVVVLTILTFKANTLAQNTVSPPSYLMYALVNNMTEKVQFYAAESELKRLSGFQKLDCRDFPPEFLTIYSAFPLSKEAVRQAIMKAGIEVFELCADEGELEKAIYRRNQLKPQLH